MIKRSFLHKLIFMEKYGTITTNYARYYQHQPEENQLL